MAGKRVLLLSILLTAILTTSTTACQSGITSRENEAKSKLGEIQKAIDRYYVDYGEYPLYLVGGSNDSWFKFHARGGDAEVVDPLLKFAYLSEYPSNPFTSQPIAQSYIVDTGGSLQNPGSGDPRFGVTGTSMANIVDDPLYFETGKDKYVCTVNQAGKCGIVNYGCFGGYRSPTGEKMLKVIPGCFFYRSTGAGGAFAGEIPKKPTRYDFVYKKNTHYILGVFGSERTEGRDVFRIQGSGEYRNADGYNYNVAMLLPEVFGGGGPTINPLFPYLKNNQVIYGSPDGLPDGVVMVLKDGKENPEAPLEYMGES
jgi:hypothetical protein